jgi:hypothetical protein
MDVAARWTAARQLFGPSYYKAGQLKVPCTAFEEDPEPRPTNPGPAAGYFLILALMGQGELSASICVNLRSSAVEGFRSGRSPRYRHRQDDASSNTGGSLDI